MSFKEIKELRTQGKLKEALELALHNYSSDSNNIWNLRALSWVYYDYLKLNAEPFNKDGFLEYLTRIAELELPAEENMFFESMVWPVSSVLRLLANEQPINYNYIFQLYNLIKDFHFTKPSKTYSVLLGALHKALKDSRDYLTIIDWWGLENLLPEDFHETSFNNRNIMALAEQVYIAYAKALLAQENPNTATMTRDSYLQKVEEFMPMLDKVIADKPSYVYPSFFKAKLLLAQGSSDVMQTFIPFAKQKKNDFWVWQLMAEIHKQDPDIVFSCYCKALSLRTPDDFLVRIRQLFAELLIQKQLFAEAKTEIDAIVKVKNQSGAKLPNQIVTWQSTSWYKKTQALKNNVPLYQQHLDKATNLLFQQEPEELIVVEFVNTEKRIVNFIKDKTKSGFFKYDATLRNPKIGEQYQVRLQHVKDSMYKLLTARKDNTSESNALKKVTGNIRISPAGFGFVEDVFIDKTLIVQDKIADGTRIQVRSVLSFNKKKEEWGWRAMEIIT